MTMATGIAARTHKGRQLIKGLRKALDDILTPPPNEEERVTVIDTVEPPSTDETIRPIPRISDAPAIMQTRDPTAKQNSITIAHTHHWQTRNNTPGAMPTI